MKCPCGGGTYVVNTLQLENAIRRQRKCKGCAQSFYTLETTMGEDTPEVKLPRATLKKIMKTKMEERRDTILKQRVDARRKAEDIKEAKAKRDYIPSYYIEDDDYDY